LNKLLSKVIIYIMAPRIFRKLAQGATRLFSKVRENSPAILNKVSEVSGGISRGLNTAAPIVGTIGVASGQPELVALGAGMKAASMGLNKVSQASKQGSIIANQDANMLERARAGSKLGQIIYN
jgi:hypothetical protein